MSTHRFLFLIASSLLMAAQAVWADPVFSPSADNAILSYQSKIFVPKSLAEDPTLAQVRFLALKQAKFLMGIFDDPIYTKLLPGTPKNLEMGMIALNEFHDAQVVSSSKDPKGTFFEVRMKIEVMVIKKLFATQNSIRIPVFLPYDPIHFYDVKCVDPLYPEKLYYFGFWSPFFKGCDKHLGVNVGQFDGLLTKSPAALGKTRPAYDRISRQAKLRGHLQISILLGFNESYKKSDDGRKSFMQLFKSLTAMGFAVDKTTGQKANYALADLILARTNDTPIKVRLALADADLAQPKRFARLVKEGLEGSDIFFYMGHSGLGSNLDLQKIERLLGEPIKFNGLYQVLYLGSCASLHWYTNSFELAKRGKRHVDIVSYGLSSLFDTQNEEALRLFTDLIAPPTRQKTWEGILHGMEIPLKGQTFFINVGSIL